MKEIEEIASKHLGKNSDGKVSVPYETPKKIDSSLLVKIPRSLNREQYGITKDVLNFIGTDIWNCYEFSTLNKNGFPEVGVLKISYSSSSEYIVESKSLKLYLNSFNMVTVENPLKIIEHDLLLLLETGIQVSLWCDEKLIPISDYKFRDIDKNDLTNTNFNVYNEDIELLTFDSIDYSNTFFKTSVLRSNCRVTNQPDWGDVYVYLDAQVGINTTSFLQYIVSLRNENHFHEEICELIYKRLNDKFKPDDLAVACFYTRRGGIDINPIRVSNPNLFKLFNIVKNEISPKTIRQ